MAKPLQPRGRMDSSKFRGVTKLKGLRKLQWQAEITINGVRQGLGCFCTEESAARAYDDALRAAQDKASCRSKRRRKEFNFPKKGERAVGVSESSHYRGVTRTGADTWEAKIRVGAAVRYLGTFHDETEAARAFDKAAIGLRGATTKTNFGCDTEASAAVYDRKRNLAGMSVCRADSDEGESKRPRQKARGHSGAAMAKPLQPRGRMDSSKFRGVTKLKGLRKLQWQAEITINGVRQGLGCFCTEESAARAYDDALRAAQDKASCRSKRRRKEFNFPKKGERAVGVSESSHYRGVTRTGADTWEAKIRVGAAVRYLGTFHDETEAARAFDKAAIGLRGATTKTNFGCDTEASAAVYDRKRNLAGMSVCRADSDEGESKRPRQKARGHSGAAMAKPLQPRDRIDYKFDVGDSGTSRWFPGTFVRYHSFSDSNCGKKRCRVQKLGATRYGTQNVASRAAPRNPDVTPGWGLVAFDDGKTLIVLLQPNHEGTVWRWHSSNAYGSEQLCTSVYASPAAQRMMRARQWQTDTTDEPMIDCRDALPIYTASSSIDRSWNGFGCFAATALTKGQFIAEYAGEIICDDESERKHRGRHSQYVFDLGDGLAVDAMPKGNPTRRINHCSSSPNTRVVIANHRGVRKVCVYATENVAADTELCFNYGAKFWAFSGGSESASGKVLAGNMPALNKSKEEYEVDTLASKIKVSR